MPNFTPDLYIDDIVLWLDAADINGNDGNSQPAEFQPIYKWFDKSKNKQIFTAGNPPQKRNGVNFSGSLGGDLLTGQVSLPVSWHMLVVAEIEVGSGLNCVLSGETSLGDEIAFIFENTTTRTDFHYRNVLQNRVIVAGPSSPIETIGLHEVYFDNAAANIADRVPYVYTNAADATPTKSADSFLTDISSNNPYTINLGKNVFNGDNSSCEIYEIIIIDGLALRENKVDLWAIQGYLQNKWKMDGAFLRPPKSVGFGSNLLAHPFRDEPPLTNQAVNVDRTSNPAIQYTRNIFNDLHKIGNIEPVQFVRLYMDTCDNVFASTANGSTCQADPTAEPCFNARAGCIDPDNYRRNENGLRSLNFSREVGVQPIDRAGFIPALISVTGAPVEIDDKKGVAIKANISIKIRDFATTGAEFDRYANERDIIAVENGTFWKAWLAQNPYYVGRPIEVFDGYQTQEGQTAYQSGRKRYIVDSMSLSNDVLEIKCKDPFLLVDMTKDKVPSPSEFSLGADVNVTTAVTSVALQRNGLATSAGEVDAYFGLSGTVRINDEIINYTRLVSEATIDLDTRGIWLTEADTHDQDDIVQKCIVYGNEPENSTPDVGETIDDAVYKTLVTEAGFPAAAINKTTGGQYSWEDEKSVWLSAFRIRTCLSEPEEVLKVVSNLAAPLGVNFFYDDESGLIAMRAQVPELDISSLLTITDDIIVEDSFKRLNGDKERLSRVYYYYNPRSYTEDLTETKYYKNLYQNLAITEEGDDFYGQVSQRTITAMGIRDGSVATSISQRLINRFKLTPIVCQFNIPVSVDNLRTGDAFFLLTKSVIGANRLPALVEMRVVSRKFDDKKQQWIIKAKQFRFGSANTGQITANAVAAYSTGGGSGTENDPYTGVRLTESYISCDSPVSPTSRPYITATIVSGGSGWTNGVTSLSGDTEILAAQGAGLTLDATASGGVVTSVAVTSNPAAGSTVADGGAQNYFDGQIVNCNDGGLGVDLQVRLNLRAKMSGGQEPYLIA